MNYRKTSDILKHELENIENRKLKRGIGMSTGYFELDRALGGKGFEPGKLYTLAGRPSMGKSALSMNFVYNLIPQLSENEVLVFISSHDSEVVQMQRLLSIGLQLNMKNIQLGELTEFEASLLNNNPFLEILSQDKIILIESPKLTSDQVKDLLKILFGDGKKVKLLVLDTIQSFQTPPTKNREEGIKELIQDLKILAIENEMVLLITSDVSRKVEYRRDNKIPTIDDMNVSRHIGYQSDFCFVLVRPEYYEVPGEDLDLSPTEAHLVIRKNIYGPLTTVLLETDMKKQLFINIQNFKSD
jgi:replicative DNA helicase